MGGLGVSCGRHGIDIPGPSDGVWVVHLLEVAHGSMEAVLEAVRDDWQEECRRARAPRPLERALRERKWWNHRLRGGGAAVAVGTLASQCGRQNGYQ